MRALARDRFARGDDLHPARLDGVEQLVGGIRAHRHAQDVAHMRGKALAEGNILVQGHRVVAAQNVVNELEKIPSRRNRARHAGNRMKAHKQVGFQIGLRGPALHFC